MARRQRLVLVVLAIGATLAVLALIAWLLLGTDGDAVVAPAAAGHADAAESATAERLPLRRAHAPEAAAPAKEEIDLETAAAAEPDGTSLFPVVRVEVVLADGSPAPRGTAYALARGDDGTSRQPVSGRLDAGGACALRLPGPGVYDVGAVGDDEFLFAVQRDVDARTTPCVRLKMPPTAEIQLDAGPSVPFGTLAKQRIVSEDDRPAAALPGDGADLACDRTFSASQLPLTFRASFGSRFRLLRQSGAYRFVPDRLTAPGTATLERDDRGAFRVLVTLDPPDRVAKRHVVLHMEFEVDGGSTASRCESFSQDWLIDAGRPLSGALRSFGGKEEMAPASHATLRWHGTGIAPGSVGFDAPDGEVVEVPVTLRLDETLPGEAEATVRIDGPPGTRDAMAWVIGPVRLFRSDSDWPISQAATVGEDTTISLPPATSPVVVANAEGLVALPAPIEPGRRVVLSLRPAGLLRVFRGIRPPNGFHFQVRRKDGGPLAFTNRERDVGWAAETYLADAFDVLGPFPQGDVTLVVSCAGRDLAEVTERVVAGETIDVHLPLAERLARK